MLAVEGCVRAWVQPGPTDRTRAKAEMESVDPGKAWEGGNGGRGNV